MAHRCAIPQRRMVRDGEVDLELQPWVQNHTESLTFT